MSIDILDNDAPAPARDTGLSDGFYPETDVEEEDQEGYDPSNQPSSSTQTSSKQEDRESLRKRLNELNAKGDGSYVIHKGEIRKQRTNKEILELLSNPKEALKGGFDEWKDQKPGWDNPGAYPAAAGAGVLDFGIGLVNKVIPGEERDLPELPQYENEGLQAVRDFSSLFIPTLYLSSFGLAKGALAHSKVGWKIGNDAFVRWLGRAGIGAAAGGIVDSVAPVQERDHNALGYLNKAWPRTWGWVPNSWKTLDNDSPELKRQKNRNEGISLGFFSDLLTPIARFAHGRSKLKEVTKWVPENEKAKFWLDKKNKKIKLSDNPIENDILHSAKSRDDALNELGKAKITEEPFTQAELGVHDAFHYTETGVRSVDEGGIVAAGIDQVKIVKNIDTRYGRLASVLSPKNFLEMTTGKKKPWSLINDLSKVFKETEIGYVGSKGRTIKHSDSLLEAEKLGAALYETDLDGMRNLLRPLSQVDLQTGQRVLSKKAYKGVMNAITKYSNDFINTDLTRTQGLVNASVGGQVSDMAEGARLMNGTPAVQRTYDQILERLEFLMNLQGQTAITRHKAVGIADIVNRLKKVGGDLETGSAIKAINSESNSTLRALEQVANDSRQTIETLKQVKTHRPQMLGPLMLAYELTDGEIASMTALNKYVRNSTGTISKAFFDGQSRMPSAVVQGVWANIYNSVLSAVGTPLKAALSNTVLMIERPLATFAGAIAHGDIATLRRAHYMYNVGIGETLQRSFSHMNQIFKRASLDPNSVGYIMRDDIARKNEAQVTFLRSFADAAEKEDNFGASIVVNQIEALNDLAEHPVLRFSANAMTGFDGFTRAFIGNIEARGKAYDAIMGSGGKITEQRVRAMARNVYGQMFDETGMITDSAVEYASREIAMNLSSKNIKSLNELVKSAPILKPFLMFPKTNWNIARFSGSHNPLGLFFDELNAFNKPFELMNIKKVDELLSSRGVSLRGNKQAAYETIRAELKGRKAIGMLSVMGAVGLFTSDRLRGSGLYDKTRQDLRRQLGWKPNTYKGLDGKWYSYDNMGPITDWLKITADVMDNYDTLDEPSLENFLNKMGYIISANLTDKSFTAGLEPLGDILAGNPAALARWSGSFGSGLVPLSGFRNELARLLTPQLKEVEMELGQILANRNPFAKSTLADKYDWMDGSKVGEPLSFWTRIRNTYSPTGKVSEGLSDIKQFLIDIEFDGRPAIRTNGAGIEYTGEQRSAITQIMGRDKLFADEVRRIMNSPEGRRFRNEWKQASDKGVYMDRKLMETVHIRLHMALRNAQKIAEQQLPDYDTIAEKQFLQEQIKNAEKMGDVQEVLRLQQLN